MTKQKGRSNAPALQAAILRPSSRSQATSGFRSRKETGSVPAFLGRLTAETGPEGAIAALGAQRRSGKAEIRYLENIFAINNPGQDMLFGGHRFSGQSRLVDSLASGCSLRLALFLVFATALYSVDIVLLFGLGFGYFDSFT